MSEYIWAHENAIDVVVNINWSKPVSHDMLYYGLAKDNEEAYFYAIIGIEEGDWRPYYIGMVYSQDISSRHKNKDHQNRLVKLTRLHPHITWHLTLGKPSFDGNRISKAMINDIEGLLIYSHWHEDSINESKINGFFSNKYYLINNTGFNDPFYKKVGFGSFTTNE